MSDSKVGEIDQKISKNRPSFCKKIRMMFKAAAAISLFLSVMNGQNANDANISQVLERFKGSWKEDTTRREGLEELLTAAEVDEKIKKVALSTPWVGEKTFAINGNTLDITGKTGPNLPGIFDNTFSHHLVADNKTIAEVDLKVIPVKVKILRHFSSNQFL